MMKCSEIETTDGWEMRRLKMVRCFTFPRKNYPGEGGVTETHLLLLPCSAAPLTF